MVQCIDGRDKFGNRLWKCICDCGNESIVSTGCLTSGNSTTCGNCPINIYVIHDSFIIGKTTTGDEFLFDLADYDLVKRHAWHIGDGYARTNLSSGKSIFLHRLILGPPPDVYIDHINRNRLDNRRANLRWATKSQNSVNSGLCRKNNTGYKGVSFHKIRHKYRARIKVFGSEKHLGLYNTPQEAAIAYNDAASFYFGEYAYLNQI